MLCIGMPLKNVIEAVTATPAKAIGWAGHIGSLTIGTTADITLLALESCDIALEDCQGQMRSLRQRLVPKGVWKGGNEVQITEPEVFE